MIEERFKKGDYIINRTCGDMAIYDKLDSKGYMHFKRSYSAMFKELRDIKAYTLQINYQTFYNLCNDDEKKKFDEIINGTVS